REMLVTLCVDWLDDALMERVACGESLWCAAEVWRAAGWRHERMNEGDAAEALYLRALEISRKQGAVGWELRAVLSLSHCWGKQGHLDRAAGLLDETCARAELISGNPALERVRALRGQLGSSG